MLEGTDGFSQEKLAAIRALNVDPVSCVAGRARTRSCAHAARPDRRWHRPKPTPHLVLLPVRCCCTQSNARFMLLVEDSLRPESLPRGWSASFDRKHDKW